MINYTNNGDSTGTVTISYTNDHLKLSKGLEYAAKCIWGGDEKVVPIPDDENPHTTVYFDDLTSTEKLDILNDWVRNQLMEQAMLQISEENHRQAAVYTENDDTITI